MHSLKAKKKKKEGKKKKKKRMVKKKFEQESNGLQAPTFPPQERGK